MDRAFMLIFLLVAGVALAAAQQEPFTIEQVMSSPFPTEMAAAPAGGMVAWVFDSAGARNIWVAQSPDYHARAITSYNSDDGQEIGELAWTPDAHSIVYVRGGDFAAPHEAPNPRDFPEGANQAVWVVDLAGGQPRKLADGHAPAVAPHGDQVAFIFKDQVWLVKLTGNQPPVQLIRDRWKAAGLRWSPDGSKLAFTSLRDDHSFIGVLDPTLNHLRYLDPSVDRDDAPEWCADSRRIAFVRRAATYELIDFGAYRTGPPWSIRVADVSTGAGREIWKAGAGRGSVFRGLAADQQLFWMADGRIVFPWEGDGWTHLYSIPAAGGAPTLMTPGDFEVENVALSPDRAELVFNSNQDDLDRRHVWKMAAGATQPTRVTGGNGIEWSPVVLSDGRQIALLRSDARWPARPALVNADGAMRDLAPETMPRGFPAAQLVDPQPVLLPAADGMQLHAQLFLPPRAQPGMRHPAVVFFHGGSRRQMLLGWNYMQYYHNAYALNQYLASRGYVVLSLNYRSGIGYGMEFREALNYGATGASEFNDVQGAGAYLRSRPDVDPLRIGAWGGSYGGYLTALALARASHVFACGVDLHGVHDWNLEFPRTLHAEDPQKLEEWARVAFASSPLADVKTWRSPVLLIQGDDDRNVSFENMVRLVQALRQQGVEFQQIVFPDEVHDFLTHEHWLEAFHAASDFFDQHLRGGNSNAHPGNTY